MAKSLRAIADSKSVEKILQIVGNRPVRVLGQFVRRSVENRVLIRLGQIDDAQLTSFQGLDRNATMITFQMEVFTMCLRGNSVVVEIVKGQLITPLAIGLL
jgi:hypothetical protein